MKERVNIGKQRTKKWPNSNAVDVPTLFHNKTWNAIIIRKQAVWKYVNAFIKRDVNKYWSHIKGRHHNVVGAKINA